MYLLQENIQLKNAPGFVFELHMIEDVSIAQNSTHHLTENDSLCAKVAEFLDETAHKIVLVAKWKNSCQEIFFNDLFAVMLQHSTLTPDAKTVLEFLFVKEATSEPQDPTKITPYLLRLMQRDDFMAFFGAFFELLDLCDYSGTYFAYQNLKIDYFCKSTSMNHETTSWFTVEMTGKKAKKNEKFLLMTISLEEDCKCVLLLMKEAQFSLIEVDLCVEEADRSMFAMYRTLQQRLSERSVKWQDIFLTEQPKGNDFTQNIMRVLDTWQSLEIYDWTLMNRSFCLVFFAIYNQEILKKPQAPLINLLENEKILLFDENRKFTSFFVGTLNGVFEVAIHAATDSDQASPLLFGFYNVECDTDFLDLHSMPSFFSAADFNGLKRSEHAKNLVDVIWAFLKYFQSKTQPISELVYNDEKLVICLERFSITIPTNKRPQRSKSFFCRINEQLNVFETTIENSHSVTIQGLIRKTQSQTLLQFFSLDGVPLKKIAQFTSLLPYDSTVDTERSLREIYAKRYSLLIAEEFRGTGKFCEVQKIYWKHLQSKASCFIGLSHISPNDSIGHFMFSLGLVKVLLKNVSDGCWFVLAPISKRLFYFVIADIFCHISVDYVAFEGGRLRFSAVPTDVCIRLDDLPIENFVQWLDTLDTEYNQESGLPIAFIDEFPTFNFTRLSSKTFAPFFDRLLIADSSVRLYNVLRSAADSFTKKNSGILHILKDVKVSSVWIASDASLVEIILSDNCIFYLVDVGTFKDMELIEFLATQQQIPVLFSSGRYNIFGETCAVDFSKKFSYFFENCSLQSLKVMQSQKIASFSMQSFVNDILADKDNLANNLIQAFAVHIALLFLADEFVLKSIKLLSFKKISEICRCMQDKIAVKLLVRLVVHLNDDWRLKSIDDLCCFFSFCSWDFACSYYNIKFVIKKIGAGVFPNASDFLVFQLLEEGSCVYFIVRKKIPIYNVIFDSCRQLIYNADTLNVSYEEDGILNARMLLSSIEHLLTITVADSRSPYENFKEITEKCSLNLSNSLPSISHEDCLFFERLFCLSEGLFSELMLPMSTCISFEKYLIQCFLLMRKNILNIRISTLFIDSAFCLIEKVSGEDGAKYRHLIFVLDPSRAFIESCIGIDETLSRVQNISFWSVEFFGKSFIEIVKTLFANSSAINVALDDDWTDKVLNDSFYDIEFALNILDTNRSNIFIRAFYFFVEPDFDVFITKIRHSANRAFKTEYIEKLSQYKVYISSKNLKFLLAIMNGIPLFDHFLTTEVNASTFYLTFYFDESMDNIKKLQLAINRDFSGNYSGFRKMIFTKYTQKLLNLKLNSMTHVDLDAQLINYFTDKVAHPRLFTFVIRLNMRQKCQILEQLRVYTTNLEFFLCLLSGETEIFSYFINKSTTALVGFQSIDNKLVYDCLFDCASHHIIVSIDFKVGQIIANGSKFKFNFIYGVNSLFLIKSIEKLLRGASYDIFSNERRISMLTSSEVLSGSDSHYCDYFYHTLPPAQPNLALPITSDIPITSMLISDSSYVGVSRDVSYLKNHTIYSSAPKNIFDFDQLESQNIPRTSKIYFESTFAEASSKKNAEDTNLDAESGEVERSLKLLNLDQ